MKTTQKNKLQCYTKTEEILDVNASVFEGNAAIQRLITRFKSNNQKLNALAPKVDTPTQWITKEKQQVKKLVLKKTYPLEVAMICYANDTNNEGLLDQVKVPRSQLYGMNEKDLIIYSSNLLARAEENIEALASFGVTPEAVADCNATLQEFKTKVGQRQILLDEKKEANDEFDHLLQQNNELLKEEMDWAIEGYQNSHPLLVTQYYASRKMPRTSSRHAAVRGHVTNKATGEPVSLGKVTVEQLNLSANITAHGMFVFKTFPEGEFKLRVENLNYKPLLITIRRYREERTRLNLVLEPLPLPHPGE